MSSEEWVFLGLSLDSAMIPDTFVHFDNQKERHVIPRENYNNHKTMKK
jgi:hypothetical protein